MDQPASEVSGVFAPNLSTILPLHSIVLVNLKLQSYEFVQLVTAMKRNQDRPIIFNLKILFAICCSHPLSNLTEEKCFAQPGSCLFRYPYFFPHQNPPEGNKRATQ